MEHKHNMYLNIFNPDILKCDGCKLEYKVGFGLIKDKNGKKIEN